MVSLKAKLYNITGVEGFISNETMNSTEIHQRIISDDDYWNEVYSDGQYKVSKAIGQYVMMVIFVLGITGNVLSFIVMCRASMRTSSTAFYMASLALSDSTVLLVGCLRRWVIEVFEIDLLNFSREACMIVNFLQYSSFDVAVWILVATTIDRAIVVVSPLKAYKYATRKRAIIALAAIITSSTVMNAHVFFTTELSEGVCAPKRQFQIFWKDSWPWVDAAAYSFVPFSLIVAFNIVIIVGMYKANSRKRRMTASSTKKRNNCQKSNINSKKLTVMLLSVSSTFIMLTAPSMVLMILREMGSLLFNFNEPHEMAKYILIRQIARVLLYVNHSINFFLYCVSGSKFRTELAAMFLCQSAKERKREFTMRSSLASIATNHKSEDSRISSFTNLSNSIECVT